MHRRSGLLLMTLLVLTALLTACGGSKATDTPKPAAPTTAPTTAPTSAAGSAAATRPAGSAATGSVVAATTAPTIAPTTAPTTAPTAAAGSAAAATRPAGSATTGSVTAGSTTAAGSSAAGAGLTLFTDPKGRFSFSRPAAWTTAQSSQPSVIVQFSTTNPIGTVSIAAVDLPSGVTVEQFHTQSLTEIAQAIPDSHEVGTQALKLDTESAIQTDYTATVSGTALYFSQIFAIHKGTGYILTLNTQPANIDAMKQQAVVVVQTWKFLQ